MTRIYIYCVLVLNLFFLTNSAYAQNGNIYCIDNFDKYRQIKYWAQKNISITDYNYKSGDSKYLGFNYKITDKKLSEETNKEILAHFDKEFERLIKGKLSFHDVEKGLLERLIEAREKYEENHDDDNFYEIFQAEEEARRNSLYGPNAGAVFCIIKIERRDFPILYEIGCSIVTNKELMNRGGLEEKKLGYSTPEHIVGELKHAITQQLERLSNTMKIIRTCN